ncbi:MAG: DUF2065 domain-containing protein [Desulfovermiculus sp.]|nr:DUF2065 domain-containing protein [Desulfovermiculus sp.]
MEFNLPFLLTALGLAFIIEGLPYFLFAERMPSVFQALLSQPPSVLRIMGVAALVGGLALVYLGKYFS